MQLITVGLEGVILRNQLVPDPTPLRIVEFSHLSDMNVFLFTGAPDQPFVLESTRKFDTWTEGASLKFLDSSGTLIFVEDLSANPPVKMFYRARRER